MRHGAYIIRDLQLADERNAAQLRNRKVGNAEMVGWPRRVARKATTTNLTMFH